jgi:malonyl-CoA O-methyltransferase
MHSLVRRVLDRVWPAPWEELGVREAYARLADGYLPEAHNPFMRLEEATMLALLPDVAGKAALDVGCGTGRYLRILRERGAATTVGLDLSPEMLSKARGLAPLARADLRALPVATARFEVVTSGLAIGHVAELAVAVAEMARVLVPGGLLLYSDFHPAARLEGRTRSFTIEGRTFTVEHHRHVPATHEAACRAAGLEIEEMRGGMSGTDPPFPAVLAIRARRRR